MSLLQYKRDVHCHQAKSLEKGGILSSLELISDIHNRYFCINICRFKHSTTGSRYKEFQYYSRGRTGVAAEENGLTVRIILVLMGPYRLIWLWEAVKIWTYLLRNFTFFIIITARNRNASSTHLYNWKLVRKKRKNQFETFFSKATLLVFRKTFLAVCPKFFQLLTLWSYVGQGSA